MYVPTKRYLPFIRCWPSPGFILPDKSILKEYVEECATLGCGLDRDCAWTQCRQSGVCAKMSFMKSSRQVASSAGFNFVSFAVSWMSPHSRRGPPSPPSESTPEWVRNEAILKASSRPPWTPAPTLSTALFAPCVFRSLLFNPQDLSTHEVHVDEVHCVPLLSVSFVHDLRLLDQMWSFEVEISPKRSSILRFASLRSTRCILPIFRWSTRLFTSYAFGQCCGIVDRGLWLRFCPSPTCRTGTEEHCRCWDRCQHVVGCPRATPAS